MSLSRIIAGLCVVFFTCAFVSSSNGQSPHPGEPREIDPAGVWSTLVIAHDTEGPRRESGIPGGSVSDALTRLDPYLLALPEIWPTRAILTSGYGPRRSPVGRTRSGYHHGLDLASDRGEPIFAVSSGVVVFSGWSGGYGNLIEIDHGFGLTTRYAHLHRRVVRAGATVSTGQRLGTMGSTGQVTGPHLHFEVRMDGFPIDPLYVLPR
jgi:murein DD-endopeptidase MepM/ murein hydrolase activator NlpD